MDRCMRRQLPAASSGEQQILRPADQPGYRKPQQRQHDDARQKIATIAEVASRQPERTDTAFGTDHLGRY
jgi:hypothetical protein